MTKEKKDAEAAKTQTPEAEAATHAKPEEAGKAAEKPAPPTGDQAKAERQAKEAEKACEKAEADQAKQARANPAQALAKRYAKYYPDCKEFHITSDLQVFLSGDKNLAILHQSGLPGGELQTIKVK